MIKLFERLLIERSRTHLPFRYSRIFSDYAHTCVRISDVPVYRLCFCGPVGVSTLLHSGLVFNCWFYLAVCACDLLLLQSRMLSASICAHLFINLAVSCFELKPVCVHYELSSVQSFSFFHFQYVLFSYNL